MKIYIACPYTFGDPAVNVKNCIAAANTLAEKGHTPFAPLLFHFWHILHPHDYEFWMKQSLSWLPWCEAVVRLQGESNGADREVKFAQTLGIPVYTMSDIQNAGD